MAVLDTMRTDIMHKAAVTIQRHVRGFMVQRQTQRIRRAVIKLQVTNAAISHRHALLVQYTVSAETPTQSALWQLSCHPASGAHTALYTLQCLAGA